MDTKIVSKKTKSNIIHFHKIKKNLNNKKISSTIAAIIAVNVVHPQDTSPEEFFINKINNNKNFEIFAFEDALDEIFEPINTDVNKSSINFINDA